MKNVIVYTKKFELDFDSNSVAQVDITKMIEEIVKDYELLDPSPNISVSDNTQYVSFKVCKKESRNKIGF